MRPLSCVLRESDTIAKISVLGLGYIGLPTSAMFATHGHTVYGYDIDQSVIEKLEVGEIHIDEPGLRAFVRDALHSGNFVPTRKVEPADVYILCVPSPLDHETKEADLSAVEGATREIKPFLKEGDVVILESTVPAGTTEDTVIPILEESGLDPRRDLRVAHCPETVLPGNMLQELAHNHRVVGGLTPEATEEARRLYDSFVKGEIVETDATTAEFVKLMENTYRDVNIALANEFAIIGREVGIDAREAIAIANEHPRVTIHHPGPGVGGHCIPLDPWFLIQVTQNGKLMREAREINDLMPRYVTETVVEMVEDVKEPRIALLGLAYKGNVDDTRESPSLEIYERLTDALPGATIRVNDPYVTDASVELGTLGEVLDGADVILITTDHADYEGLDASMAAKLVRTRRVIDARDMITPGDWRRNGFQVERI